MSSYKDLLVWQRALELVTMVYKATSKFPKEETYTLTSQVRRAAISIPSNIAEGSARNTSKSFLYFLDIAVGSLRELETQLIISVNLEYLNEEEFSDLDAKLNEVGKMMSGLKRSIANKPDR